MHHPTSPCPFSSHRKLIYTYMIIYLYNKYLLLQYSIINYSHHAVHYIPKTYLHYNWKFVPHILIANYFNNKTIFLIKNTLYIRHSPIFHLRKLCIKGITLNGIGISKL